MIPVRLIALERGDILLCSNQPDVQGCVKQLQNISDSMWACSHLYLHGVSVSLIV